MARDNPRWGSERIRGELLKLGIAVSKRSIQRYRRRGPARPPSQTWRTFLANHARASGRRTCCTVQTLTFKTLYVLVLIAHGRRELVHVAVTAHPAAAWVWRQVVEATAWGRRPRFLLRDRDAVYGGDFGSRLAALGVEQLLTPVRAPRANAVAERLDRHPPARVPGSPDRAQRAAPPRRARRVRRVLQQRSAPPDPQARDAAAGGSAHRRADPRTAGARRPAPHLRASRLITHRLLRPHSGPRRPVGF